MPGAPAHPRVLEPAGEDDAYRAAMRRAGRLLAARPRTRRDLADRLAVAGTPGDVTARVLARLEDLGLVDDTAFARAWIEERARRKGLGARALAAELEAKGVDPAVVAAALADADLDEERRAAELVASDRKSTR